MPPYRLGTDLASPCKARAKFFRGQTGMNLAWARSLQASKNRANVMARNLQAVSPGKKRANWLARFLPLAHLHVQLAGAAH